jgi:AcrR family transcriptional regulator
MRLSREDWINGAWKLMAKGSFDLIKVDRLAKTMRVTRGSFYWHFENRDDLLDALLDHWLDQLGVENAIQPRLEHIESPADKLWAINKYVVRNIGGPQFAIMRIWASQNRKLGERIRTEDAKRIAHYAKLFGDMGLNEAEAKGRAELYFASVMSEYLRYGLMPLEERLEKARFQHDILTRL